MQTHIIALFDLLPLLYMFCVRSEVTWCSQAHLILNVTLKTWYRCGRCPVFKRKRLDLLIVKQNLHSQNKWHAFLTLFLQRFPSSFVPSQNQYACGKEKMRLPYFSSGYDWRFEKIQMQTRTGTPVNPSVHSAVC